MMRMAKETVREENDEPRAPLLTGQGGSSPSSSSHETFLRLLAMAKPERHLMLFSGVALAVSTGVNLAIPYAAGQIIDVAIHDDEESDKKTMSTTPLFVLFGVMSMGAFLSYLRTLWQAQAGHHMVARLRRNLYAAILSQDAAYFDSMPQGDLISRLSSDADLVQSAVTDQFLSLLKSAVTVLGAIALLVATSPSLALISVSVLPPMAFVARMVGRQMKDRYRKVRELHAKATSLAEQSLTCIRTVQHFVAEDYESHQYNQAIHQAHAEAIKNAKYLAIFAGTVQILGGGAMLCVLGYGGMLVASGKLTPGDLAGFVMYSLMLAANVSMLSSVYVNLMKAVAAANRVFEILDRTPSIPPPNLSVPDDIDLLNFDASKDERYTPLVARNGQGNLELMEMGMNDTSLVSETTTQEEPISIEFQDVSFSYPTRPESRVLNGFNLSIGAGQVVALVGSSGAGKSTVASLLTRLYDAQAGAILMDGSNIQTMEDPREHVRKNVGIVVQEPLLFPSTIRENIRYGKLHATDEEVQEAARLAHVLDFSSTFPNGLDTVVGPRGTQLSGGQKQRVAVARCILKNPPVVVFDEATSALDAESEHHVQQAIDTACKGRTVIMIAHRLSTIRNVDQIAVLKDGRVVEQGTFDELVDKPSDGAFRQLMQRQLLS